MLEHLTPEDLENYRRRDDRIAALDIALRAEGELRDSVVLRAVMGAISRDFDLSVKELCEVSPTDTKAVARNLVAIRSFVYIRDVFDALINAGRNAEAKLRAEDPPVEGEDE